MSRTKSQKYLGNGMEKTDIITVPYIVYEGEMARAERRQKRDFIVILILIIALVLSNAGWIYYESQWETVSVTQENEDGYNNYIGNDGDIYNGTTDD